MGAAGEIGGGCSLAASLSSPLKASSLFQQIKFLQKNTSLTHGARLSNFLGLSEPLNILGSLQLLAGVGRLFSVSKSSKEMAGSRVFCLLQWLRKVRLACPSPTTHTTTTFLPLYTSCRLVWLLWPGFYCLIPKSLCDLAVEWATHRWGLCWAEGKGRQNGPVGSTGGLPQDTLCLVYF